MAYTKTAWVNNSSPYINADNLNKIENQLETNTNDIETNTTNIQTNTEDITTNTNNISNLSTYSTAEKVIGKWIDNKPLYRKVIDFGQLPNNTVKSVAHNIQNLKEIVKLSGFARSSINNGGITLPHAVSSPVALYCDNTNINITTTSDRTDFSGSYIYVEYTKTTD